MSLAHTGYLPSLASSRRQALPEPRDVLAERGIIGGPACLASRAPLSARQEDLADRVAAGRRGTRAPPTVFSPLAPWGRGAGGEGAVCVRAAQCNPFPLTPDPSPPRGEGDKLLRR